MPNVSLEDRVPQILANLPTRISDVARRWSQASPQNLALVESSGAWTFGQLQTAVDETQSWLVSLGVRPGDRVLIVCENCRALVAILLAVASLDALPVLVNAKLSAREVDEIREHCGARRAFYTADLSHQAREHANRHGAAMDEIANLGLIGIGSLNHDAGSEPLDANEAERVAALIYTSGTTGLPKGVMLTNKNLLYMAAMSTEVRNITPADRMYGVLPMSHAVGLSVVLLGALYSGATLYIAPRFDPAGAFRSLEQDKLTIVLGVPAFFALLVDYAKMKGIASLDLPALRIISSSGAPLHPHLKSEVENLFHRVLHNGYGVTECSPTIAQTRPDTPRKDRSIGRVFPGVEVKLAGLTAEQIANGEVGELCVRGPNIMKGYYRDAEATAAAIDADGWFNTRDLARFEGDHLFIVGRTKDLIVRFGFNVYPAEVEGVLNAHPQVVRSAVVGRTVSSECGEEIIAFVQPQPNSPVTTDEISEHAAQYLSPYKRPTAIIFANDLPVSPTGKVLKEELAKQFSSNPSER